tara:strand:+ start:146 stop:406 length:261 start_codon:yes stop_codon:yes gene_type:complete
MNIICDDITEHIYNFDGRYIENKNKVINELKNKINIFNIKKYTILESHLPYLELENYEYKSYFMYINKKTFIDYFFNNFNYNKSVK